MNPLTAERVSVAVHAAGLAPVEGVTSEKLAVYGNLILKWNERTNLTAITDPEALLQRHLVESVAAAQALPSESKTLLDYGSGAGLPGIPIALCRPDLAVTLAESQSKKAAFLREAARSRGIKPTVYPGRVAEMPAYQRFDIVTMRAVDRMSSAVLDAIERVTPNGWLALFVSEKSSAVLEGANVRQVKLPTVGSLILQQAPFVPRGTAK